MQSLSDCLCCRLAAAFISHTSPSGAAQGRAPRRHHHHRHAAPPPVVGPDPRGTSTLSLQCPPPSCHPPTGNGTADPRREPPLPAGVPPTCDVSRHPPPIRSRHQQQASAEKFDSVKLQWRLAALAGTSTNSNSNGSSPLPFPCPFPVPRFPLPFPWLPLPGLQSKLPRASRPQVHCGGPPGTSSLSTCGVQPNTVQPKQCSNAFDQLFAFGLRDCVHLCCWLLRPPHGCAAAVAGVLATPCSPAGRGCPGAQGGRAGRCPGAAGCPAGSAARHCRPRCREVFVS